EEADGEDHVSFEQLRDILTRHRRAWAEKYLKSYLRSRWETELRAVGEEHQRAVVNRGKALTPKQFAKLGAPAANHWFGGDLTGVYRVLGMRTPQPPARRKRLVPRDPDWFATELYEELRGEPIALPPAWKEDPDERARYNSFTALAGFCAEYL